MATNKSKSVEEIRQENLEASVSKTEKFFQENSKTIWCTLAAILVVGLCVLGYSKFIYAPAVEEAQAAAFKAEAAFQAADYELALKGDGDVLGFEQVIDEYGSKAGAAAYLYAGICEMQLGNFESALSYLKKYNGKEALLAARALALQGDAEVALENYEAAVKCFNKAAAKADNVFAASYLFKAGLVYEKLGETEAALDCYKEIKNKYPESIEGYDIDRYITALEK